MDTPGDEGGSIDLTWDLSSDDGTGKNTVVGYCVFRQPLPLGSPTELDSLPSGTSFYADQTATSNQKFNYWVTVVDTAGVEMASEQNYALAADNIDVPIGDFTSDSKSGINDLSRFVNTYPMNAAHPEYDPLFDLDMDQQIQTSDFAIFASHFGEGGIPVSDPPGNNSNAAIYYRTFANDSTTKYVDVWIENIQNIAGYSMKVVYPAATLTLVDVTPDSSGTGNNVLNQENGLTPLFMVHEPIPGTIYVAYVIKNPRRCHLRTNRVTSHD